MDENDLSSIQGLLAKDQEFLAGQNQEVLQQEDFAKLIDRFHGKELGRAIMLINKSSDPTQPPIKQVVGYILPTTPEGNQHLIVMKDGTMVVVGPQYEDEQTLTKYKNSLSPNELPIDLNTGTIQENLEAVITDYKAYIKPVFRNDRPEDSGKIEQAIENAFTTAGELQIRRNQVRKDSMVKFQDLAKGFFNEGGQNNPNPGQEPPPSLPV